MLIHTGTWTNSLTASIYKGQRRCERRRIFFSSVLIFSFTVQVAMATFYPSPCPEWPLSSEVPQVFLVCQRGLTKGSTPAGERAIFWVYLYLAPLHCSTQAWRHPTVLLARALNAATACSGACFRMARLVGEEELLSHLGNCQQRSFTHSSCACSASSSAQTLWARAGIQMKDSWFEILVEFLPIAVNVACFNLSGKYFCHSD